MHISALSQWIKLNTFFRAIVIEHIMYFYGAVIADHFMNKIDLSFNCHLKSYEGNYIYEIDQDGEIFDATRLKYGKSERLWCNQLDL